MTRTQWIVIVILVPVVAFAGLVLGNAFDGDDATADNNVQVASADGEAEYEPDYLIPPGTAGRIAAGEPIEIVPAELVVQVGDAIRIVNNDSEDHIVGVFFVAAGETLTQRFQSEGVLEGECSVHPSGAFTLRVEA